MGLVSDSDGRGQSHTRSDAGGGNKVEFLLSMLRGISQLFRLAACCWIQSVTSLPPGRAPLAD